MEFNSRLQARDFQTAFPSLMQASGMSWNKRAKDVLRQRGWKIAELAKRAGVDLEALYKQLRDVDQPRGDTMKKIARTLGVSGDCSRRLCVYEGQQAAQLISQMRRGATVYVDFQGARSEYETPKAISLSGFDAMYQRAIREPRT